MRSELFQRARHRSVCAQARFGQQVGRVYFNVRYLHVFSKRKPPAIYLELFGNSSTLARGLILRPFLRAKYKDSNCFTSCV